MAPLHPTDSELPVSDEERLPTPLALPTPPTPLIGRATELALLQAQIVRAEVRLLTLTGPPGVGKTRLALAVAQAVHAAFPGGVWFVDLSPISDAALVLPTIAQALGFTVDDASIRVALADCFDEPCLLVLDNMEQVLPAAADLAPLLVACPALAILVTSRAPLNLRWEQTFPVLPLPRQVALTPERLVGLALLKRLDVEREEVRAAFERSLHQADDGVQTLQYAVALAPVWMLRGELHSGRAWLTQVVQRASTSSGTPALLVVLSWAATFAYQQGDLDAAHAYHEQCLTLSVQLDDQPRRAAALLGLALLHDVRGAYDQALVLNKQALTVYNVLADVGGRAWVLANMGHVVQQQGDHGRAVTMFAESLRLFTNLADLRGQAWAQIGLGHNAWAQPDVSTAAQHYAASLALFNMLGDVRGIAWATTNSGRVAQAQGDIASALALHAQSLAAYRTVGDARGIARALLYQGETLIAANQGVEAEAALNEALALFTRIGDAPNAARTRVVQESLTADTPAALLTPREQDVLGLVAQGLSNRAIATRLTITSGTVNVHLAAIYRKLGVSSRTAALHAARAQALL